MIAGGRPRATTPSAAQFEALRYDQWGDLWQRDDFAGHTTTFGYDTRPPTTARRAKLKIEIQPFYESGDSLGVGS